MGLFIHWNTSYKAATHCFHNFDTRLLYTIVYGNICTRTKLKVLWNGLPKIFLLSYYTSKWEQAENSLALPTMWQYFDNVISGYVI